MVVQELFNLPRVDVHYNRADLSGGELHDYPFRVVHRPDADPVSSFHAKTRKTMGCLVFLPDNSRYAQQRFWWTDTTASLSGCFAAILSTISQIVIPGRGNMDVPLA